MPAHRKKGMDTFCFCSRYILYKKADIFYIRKEIHMLKIKSYERVNSIAEAYELNQKKSAACLAVWYG